MLKKTLEGSITGFSYRTLQYNLYILYVLSFFNTLFYVYVIIISFENFDDYSKTALPANDLLMHVIEKFAPSIFVDNLGTPTEWIDQMPMPVMKVDTKIFPKISNFMFRISV